ncbi:MAG: sensor histidine kinase [Anaerolineae bacterium]|nr:sensor histidine kinase [Gemmatimonadaceae bacterium]
MAEHDSRNVVTNVTDRKSERQFRLLPPNTYLGWTPYAWLVYLPIFLIEPVVRTRLGRGSAGLWAITLAGVVVFLIAYFRGYWVGGRRMLPVVAVLVALAVGFSPVNTGSSVFFIYAASFAAQLPRARDAFRLILGITVIAAVSSWATDAPLYFWISSVVITPIIGGVNLHFAQIERSNAKLRLAQKENEHLATVAERERIARDLHDVLGHTLSLIVLKAELACKLADRDPQRAAREIRDVEQVSRKALQEVREAIRGYRATLDDELARARSLLTAASIRGEVSAVPVTLERAQEETLAMALREAVTNVVRHSGADVCRIQIASEDGNCVLDVEDDGSGIIVADGSGLRGMRQRVEALGGTVGLARARGTRGMRVRVTIPAAGSNASPEVSALAIPDAIPSVQDAVGAAG